MAVSVDRESWERRWSADPTLRPEGLKLIRGEWVLQLSPRKTLVTIFAATATALIVARVVEWLLLRGDWKIRRSPKGEWIIDYMWNDGRTFHARYDDPLDALGAAVDEVLAGREAAL